MECGAIIFIMYKYKIIKPYANPESDRICYEAWISKGTLAEALKVVQEKAVPNKRSKVISTQDGVRKAAVRYMIYNYDKAKEQLIEEYKKYGYLVEENAVELYMIKLAISTLLVPERIKFWMQEHGLLEKYQDTIEYYLKNKYSG